MTELSKFGLSSASRQGIVCTETMFL